MRQYTKAFSIRDLLLAVSITVIVSAWYLDHRHLNIIIAEQRLSDAQTLEDAKNRALRNKSYLWNAEDFVDCEQGCEKALSKNVPQFSETSTDGATDNPSLDRLVVVSNLLTAHEEETRILATQVMVIYSEKIMVKGKFPYGSESKQFLWEEVHPKLMSLLNDSSSEERGLAALCLGNLTIDVPPTLRKLLRVYQREGNEDTKNRLAWAISKLMR